MKTLQKCLLILMIFLGLQSVSHAQNLEFTTHFGLSIVGVSSGEFGIGLRFPISEDLRVGLQFGFLGAGRIGGIDLNLNVAYALGGLRFYAGPEIVFGNYGSFGLVAGTDWYFTDYFGVYVKTHLLFGGRGFEGTVLLGILLPPQVFSWVLRLFTGNL